MKRSLIRLILPVCAAIGAGVALATPGTAVAGTQASRSMSKGTINTT